MNIEFPGQFPSQKVILIVRLNCGQTLLCKLSIYGEITLLIV